MRRFLGILFSGVLLLALAGCGKEEEYTNSYLEIAKDGTVTAVMVEEFKKSFYDLEGLEDMIRLEVANYNTEAGEERITLKSIEVKEANVVGVMKYKSAEDYTAYNDTEYKPMQLFAGTIKEAKEAGIDLNISLVSSTADDVIGKDQLLGLEGYYLVMWSEPIEVRTSGSIKYYSDNLSLTQSNQIMTREDGAAPYYLVFK